MSRKGLIALCLFLVAGFGVAEAANSPFGSARVQELGLGKELPPPATLDGQLPEGSWESLNTLSASQKVVWGNRLAVTFDGFPGLWLYEDGTWQELTSSTPTHLLVACRSLVAAFPGFGIYLHTGEGWIPLNGNDPLTMDAFGNERLLVDFGPGVGFWNYECPAAISCAFLDNATWATVDVGRDILASIPEGILEPPPVETDVSVIYTTISGNSLFMSFYEDGICDELVEEFQLNNDCTFSGEFLDEYLVGPDCTATDDELVIGRFTESGINALINESVTHAGTFCPPDSVYEGTAIGAPCPAEICWPCTPE